MPLFLLFLIVPILEIALFIQVGGWIGLWPTLLIVVLTAIAGTVLVRTQGLSTIRQLQSNLQAGRDPVGPIAHGALILVAGVLLLTPGFFTDAVALGLLVPSVRAAAIRWGTSRITVFAATQMRRSPEHGARPDPRKGPETVEGDYVVVDEPTSNENADHRDRSSRSKWTSPPPD